jgi:hypothetical protein
MAWGFVVVLLGVPVVLTYRSLQSASPDLDLIWVTLAGIVVTSLVAAILELQHRNLA